MTLKDDIFVLIQRTPGLTDREITNLLLSRNAPPQSVNQAALSLETKGILKRAKRSDGLIGNYSTGIDLPIAKKSISKMPANVTPLSEDSLKGIIKTRLEADGWKVVVMWGRERGIDIEADREGKRWIIEVKGIGSLSAMRVNYFLAILGETLQRMADPEAKYSIALPNIQQYRNLWGRLPQLAKERTGISILFVSENGTIEEA